MNSLHPIPTTWISDGSNGTLTQNQNTLTVASASAGTPFNVRLQASNSNNLEASQLLDYYVQATITTLQGHLSIGAVSEEEFRPGWKVKGMFYNGNLTNGSAALKTSWGPHFQAGDSVGVRVVTPSSSSSAEGLKVAFYKNGACLGTGFELASTSTNNTLYFPCIHVSGSASLEVDIPSDLPPLEIPQDEPSGIFGDWKLETALDGETPISIPAKRLIKLILSNGDKSDNLKMNFLVGNNIGGTAKIVESTSATAMHIECGPFMSTRMMPPPELQPLEQLFTTKKITDIKLFENTTLVVSGPELKTEWSRLIRTPETLQHY